MVTARMVAFCLYLAVCFSCIPCLSRRGVDFVLIFSGGVPKHREGERLAWGPSARAGPRSLQGQ